MSVSAFRLSFLCLLLLECVVATVTTLVRGTDHIVGANRGWNPGINYTLWANNHTFYIGDLIRKCPPPSPSSQSLIKLLKPHLQISRERLRQLHHLRSSRELE
uniref:Phytocyanin domain-containing protein n=1 Tax=Nelumbo nucifera TaxID=4432 RepID=A0A822YLA4_NELNU|nr:TPA_asm: hypothetical protein HUJ06_011212 [Nelumbo nucifera]